MDLWGPLIVELQIIVGRVDQEDLEDPEDRGHQEVARRPITFMPINLMVLEEVPLVDLVCQTLLQIVDLPTLVNSEVTHLVGRGHQDLPLFLALDLHSLLLARPVAPHLVG